MSDLKFKKMWRQHVWKLRTRFGTFTIVPVVGGMRLTYRRLGWPSRYRTFHLGVYEKFARASYIGRLLARPESDFEWDVNQGKVR